MSRYFVMEPDGSGYTYGQPEVIDDLREALVIAEDRAREMGSAIVVGTDIRRCFVVSRCPSGGDCGYRGRGRCGGLGSDTQPIGCPRRTS